MILSVKTFVGETLELTGVLRQEMGMYLCIASNNVPPTVSKRYSVDVHCEKLLPSDKYTMSEYALSEYSRQMNLTVKSLEKRDFGGYVCSSVNALGKADGSVRLQELQLSSKTTPTTLMKNIDKSRKKILSKGKKKSNNSNGRRGHTGDFEADFIGSDDDFGTTQIMVGSTLQEGQRTDRPLVPSLPPPWIVHLNAANFRHPSVSAILLLLLLPTTL
ncbi:lachesin-like isoform x4 protein [Lasius niger]|uniref:Lachesin-like isoform x4 protein n=1 Tax=Lasius niger TaxID=67767 RepID=A0A0J7KZV3_LASNI|nr:lachesin-like isoform x4 protein [Lasius niger]